MAVIDDGREPEQWEYSSAFDYGGGKELIDGGIAVLAMEATELAGIVKICGTRKDSRSSGGRKK